MRMIEMSDGAALATTTAGAQQNLLPVVLLHGGPGLWDNLAPLAELISDDTLVHRYDQRGCGGSSPVPVSQLTIDRYVADLEELRQAWGHDRWIVVGHSFGAGLALAYAAAHPDRAAALGYLSGTGIGDWHSLYRAERARRRAGFADRLTELSGRERTWEEEVQWRTLSWSTDFADPSEGQQHAADMARCEHRINHDANRALRIDDADLIAAATALTCPSWFIHGALDPRPVSTVVDLAAHARQPRKRIIEHAGHLPWIEQPDRTREVLLEVLHSGA